MPSSNQGDPGPGSSGCSTLPIPVELLVLALKLLHWENPIVFPLCITSKAIYQIGRGVEQLGNAPHIHSPDWKRSELSCPSRSSGRGSSTPQGKSRCKEWPAFNSPHTRIPSLGMAQGSCCSTSLDHGGAKQKCTSLCSCKRNSHRGALPGINQENLFPRAGMFPPRETKWTLVCCWFLL